MDVSEDAVASGRGPFLEKDEEEIASGLLPFTINGRERLVPELKWRANRAWQAQMQEVFASLLGVPADTPEGIAAMADSERQLVLAYDTTGALGDLEDATEREIDAIYNRLIQVSYPLAQSQTAVALALVRAVAESARASSTSGPSPAGTSEDPMILKPRSRSARSSSTTGRRRSA